MSFPPRPAVPTVARHVPTLTEVIEVQPQPLPDPVLDVALPLSAEPEPVAAVVDEEPGLVLADEPVPSAPAPLTELDRAVLPRAVLQPAAIVAPAVPEPSRPEPLKSAPVSGLDEAQIVQRVHADLQRQIDGMLEYRLREAMAPVLARTTELLVRELRQELSKTMKDVVARAVAQEVARQRSRQGQ